jgi:hypothetical protein
MKGKSALLLVAGVLSLWLASGFAYAQEAKGTTAVGTVAGVQVEFVAPQGGLVEGENAIAVQAKDTATGKPLVQDGVRVEMTMDTTDRSMNHGDMSTQKPVLAELKASQTPGTYTGKVSLSGVGKWNAKVYLDAQRSTIIGVSVAAGGPNMLLIGGGAATVLALAAAGVFVLKRKAAAPTGAPTSGESINRARLAFNEPSDQ